MNLIIKNSDKRFNQLSDIYRRYDFSNLVREIPNNYYYIPPELLLNEFNSRSLIVSFYPINNDNWIYGRMLNRVLKITCELDTQLYFDILFLNINCSDKRPKCKNCGSPLNWSGFIKRGYSNHDYRDFENLFCSARCSTKYIHLHPEIYGLYGYVNPEIHAKTQLSKFLNSGTESGYFYIASTKFKEFKFGICSDIDIRYRMGEVFLNYSKIKVLEIGSKDYIGNLEYLVKKNLGFPKTEFLDWKDNHKFRSSFIKSLIELNQ